MYYVRLSISFSILLSLVECCAFCKISEISFIAAKKDAGMEVYFKS